MDFSWAHNSDIRDEICVGCNKFYYEERLKFIMLCAATGDKKAIKFLKRIHRFSPCRSRSPFAEEQLTKKEIVFYMVVVSISLIFGLSQVI